MPIRPVIYGCASTSLTLEERHFFKEQQPFGFILFARNIESPGQLLRLTDEMRDVSGRDDVPILIDQEGGRVARLKPPHWRAAPPAAIFGKLADEDVDLARQACYLNARLIAEELRLVGINVDCAPLLDIPAPGSHDIIGDRAFHRNNDIMGILGEAQAEGLLDSGVMPVIKHLPGHGRAMADSHEERPTVTASHEELRRIDFVPFQRLKDYPYGMTAHIVYTALDPKHIATTSPAVIRIIREEIGFKNLLMSDDLSMHAMDGDFSDRARQTLDAGCDLILHCNGKMEEMLGIAKATEQSELPNERLAILTSWKRPLKRLDPQDAQVRLDELLAGIA